MKTVLWIVTLFWLVQAGMVIQYVRSYNMTRELESYKTAYITQEIMLADAERVIKDLNLGERR